MRKVTIELDDGLIHKLESLSANQGLSRDQLIVRSIQQLVEPAPTPPNEWMPREQWDALVRGENCPLCNEVASANAANEYGYTIADLAFSRLRLAANQFVAGYCVLVCKKHVKELYDLAESERGEYVADLVRAAKAIETVYHPIKMNFEILGNSVPHLHCHIVPRYYGDPAPGRPIDPGLRQVLLGPAAYEQRVQSIQGALERVALL